MEGVVTRRPLKDQLTPYKMVLLYVVEEHCSNLCRPPSEQHPYMDKGEREFMMVLLQLVQSADLELKDLMQKLSEVACPDLMAYINMKLRDSFEGFDEIMDLMMVALNKLFKNSMLHKSSIIGFFVRRMQLAYERLTFSGITKLYTRYKAFYRAYKPLETQTGGVTSDSLDISNIGDASMSIIEIMGGKKKKVPTATLR